VFVSGVAGSTTVAESTANSGISRHDSSAHPIAVYSRQMITDANIRWRLARIFHRPWSVYAIFADEGPEFLRRAFRLERRTAVWTYFCRSNRRDWRETASWI